MTTNVTLCSVRTLAHSHLLERHILLRRSLNETTHLFDLHVQVAVRRMPPNAQVRRQYLCRECDFRLAALRKLVIRGFEPFVMCLGSMPVVMYDKPAHELTITCSLPEPPGVVCSPICQDMVSMQQ